MYQFHCINVIRTAYETHSVHAVTL